MTVVPDYGYHFTQWSDGLKDNPRIAQITQDTTFTAEFAYDRVGTCGKDLALVWSYDPTNKVLTIGNAGSFTENMQFGVEAPNEMEELVIGNSVTAIGANAFAGIETLKKVSIGESVKTIGEQAFYNCVNLETIFNYRPTPTNTYSNAFDGVDKFECTLYVLPNSIDMYKAAAVWRDFYYTYAIGAEEATVTTNDVQVEPQDNAVVVTWPVNNEAASYTIEITKDGEVFCRLVFNANGQLTGIAFAPSPNGTPRHAPTAKMTANGLQFTVTGLNSNTNYGYSVTTKDANDQPIASYSGEFTTTGEVPTSVDQVPSDQVQSTKFLRDGQIFILRGDKIYNAQGAMVK
ncbi:MAG: leucine-rich repeat protein [Paludibacteraceae bacterium]|nr:leucine-rich repeat protein [Paludibacteraceae bacterium]